MIEVAVGLMIAVVAVAAVAQLVALVSLQRRTAAELHAAALAAGNVMEQVAALPWERLTTEDLAAVELPTKVGQWLDEPRLSITVTPLDDTLPARRIDLQLDWRDRAGNRVEPLRLTAWRHGDASDE